MIDIADQLRAWCAEHRPFALATVTAGPLHLLGAAIAIRGHDALGTSAPRSWTRP
ncbi:hypothetical protein [Streptomyces melanosporofaciens]|uniref:hypothetical protein n=1 Tax=Streptomyces melanosporofaciens TaxID=67327 RepID=UPI001AD7E597|nr:hypothetical protein [Streptomyces melanosporofaciens]